MSKDLATWKPLEFFTSPITSDSEWWEKGQKTIHSREMQVEELEIGWIKRFAFKGGKWHYSWRWGVELRDNIYDVIFRNKLKWWGT